jgi:hypothetical protein
MRQNGTVRCAIYTRKSSEEGLEQEFNSLPAQREACEAFIDSVGSSASAILAPDITQTILDGRQPRDLTAENLLAHSRLPLAWHDQRTVLGFG